MTWMLIIGAIMTLLMSLGFIWNMRPLQRLDKEIKAIESKMEKHQALLGAIEQQLADTSIYDEGNKQQLKTIIAEQAVHKKVLLTLEEQWLEKQTLLEGQFK